MYFKKCSSLLIYLFSFVGAIHFQLAHVARIIFLTAKRVPEGNFFTHQMQGF